MFAGGNIVADLLNGERNLGDKDDVRATGNAGLQRDPAGIASHDFDSHDPVMRFGGGVDFVDRIGGRVQGGVKAEGHVGGGQVVIDGLRNPYQLHAFPGKLQGDFLGAVPANCDDGV